MEGSRLDEASERIATAIVNSAFDVHKTLGPGLLESVYELCLCHELAKRGFQTKRQVIVPIIYDGVDLGEGFRLDVVVEGQIICEVKAVTEVHAVCKAQLLTYLKLTGLRLGFLINFNVPLIKDGIQRIIR
jgi:GxxExxY protein